MEYQIRRIASYVLLALVVPCTTIGVSIALGVGYGLLAAAVASLVVSVILGAE